MDFPIISPGFYKELTDNSDPANDGIKYTLTVSPESIEYSFPLNQERVVRKLMEIKDTLFFYRQDTVPEKVAHFVKQRDELVKKYPRLKYYGYGKMVMMNAIQDKNYSIEKRMLIMNFMIRSLQNAVDSGRENEIPQFVNGFVNTTDRTSIMNYYKELQPNFQYSIMDAFSMMRGMPSTPEFDEVRKTVFSRMGFDEEMSQPEKETVEAHIDDYIKMKRFFSETFLGQGKENGREYYFENVMVNYIWTFSMPYADYNLNLWQNFVFYNVIFNTIKVMLTCYITEKNSDEDFVKAITAFDGSIQLIRGSMAAVTYNEVEKRGFDTNGDMAILALS